MQSDHHAFALWEGMHFMKENLHVIVSSSDGWGWLLAWLQAGMTEVSCLPIGPLASQQLKELMEHPSIGTKIKVYTDDKTTTKLAIYCYHITTITSLDNVLSSCHLLPGALSLGRIMFISLPPITKLMNMAQEKFSSNFRWHLFRHNSLGGLTSARLSIGWTRLDNEPILQRSELSKRPLWRFLEPAARNVRWRNSSDGRLDTWYPHESGASPFPWPWKNSPTWVDTHSVFLKAQIQRHFTAKEKCQLYDLKYEWRDLLPAVWEWLDGHSPPLRMMVEFIVAMGTPLRTRLGMTQWKAKVEDLDWGRERPPWIGHGILDDKQIAGDRMKYFGWVWDQDELTDIAVACKGDDATVDLSLWAVGGNTPEMEHAREKIRDFLWTIWLRRIRKEALTWVRENDTPENWEAVTDCLRRCTKSDWWNWDHGSRLFFWRWPKQWADEARDGAIGFHTKTPRPRLQFPQVPITEEWVRVKDLEKLEKLLRREYIVRGRCLTTVPRFPVPKGTDDIRVVWDLAKNGVNETMYTPTFFLATMPTYIRRVSAGAYGGDFDIGEQFHNYLLHQSEQIYCGVVIPEQLRLSLQSDGIQTDKYMRWGRLVFGWQSSPYLALRMFSRAVEIAKGPPHEPNNVFGWERVQLNLPGADNYDPGEPRVSKINVSGTASSDIVTFYDDGRVFGSTEEQAHQALRQITSRLQWLGNQDAARKRRGVSQRPGAWAGGVIYSDQGILRVFVSTQKWEKAKVFLDWVWDCLNRTPAELERNQFRSGKGFLVHMSTCYDFIQPYLKGFHLSEDAWRPNRDAEGWKIKLDEHDSPEVDVEDDEEFFYESEDFKILDPNNQPPKEFLQRAPPTIYPVSRLREDVRILRIFFQPPTPVQVIVRPVEGSTLVVYGGGDASGEGFGAHLHTFGNTPLLRRGFWCPSYADESSNWREFRNLLDTIRNESESGRLAGREIWLATDNSTAAYAYYKGSSKSKMLHEMVTELRMLTITGNFILRIYHIAGTRMIESGIDGLSRGELQVDELNRAVKTLMPLHRSPSERSSGLKDWLDSWLDPNYQIATPNDWFYKAHQSGDDNITQTWVWEIAPAAAIHVVEELGIARLKRHNILRGVVLIPSLLSHEWFRRFSKIVDVYFIIAPGSIPFWPSNMHEPLTVGLYLPLFRHRPWDWKRVPFMVPFGVSLSAMYKIGEPQAGDILREFWGSCIGVAEMPKRLVCDLLQNTSWRRFLHLSSQR